MLVLSVPEGRFVRVGKDIDVIVSRIKGNRVVLGFQAPDAVRIVRGELLPPDQPDDVDLDDLYTDTGNPVGKK